MRRKPKHATTNVAGLPYLEEVVDSQVVGVITTVNGDQVLMIRTVQEDGEVKVFSVEPIRAMSESEFSDAW
jgi:hypothetical protein